MQFKLLLAAAIAIVPAQAQRPDLIIRNGSIIDGTGSPARRADIAITADRITFIGDATAAHLTATRTIDAAGLTVTPGFIDPHTHTAADLSSKDRKSNIPYLMQGVTTVVTNNDGSGPVDIGALLSGWTKNGIGTNAAAYAPQGSIRAAVMGMTDAVPNASQLDSMKRLVASAMDAGAIGMSTGLYYAPGSYSSTEEVIALAKVVAAHGGIYDSHIRDESSYTIGLVAAVNEVIRIGRDAQIPVHISHIKALGADVWGMSDSIVTLMKAARASGVDITAAQYPYDASGTSVGASLLPRWAEVGGRDSLAARIHDKATHERLTLEMTENMRRRGGANTLLITGGRDATIRGKRLDEVAHLWNTTPVEAAFTIILAGDANVASFNMNEKDIETFMRQDFIMTDSDGSDGHPRKYGTFPKLIREYVNERHVLTLPQAIHRSTQETAHALRLADRGELAVGRYADVIVFDPNTFVDRSTYEQPTLLSVGMRYVVVNGTVAVDAGTYTGATAGRALRR